MRIGCLQFNPQVGDVDNNLSRADSVLLKAKSNDLDLLVLPEMAFTGYNFKFLRDIVPFLEPSGSGISSLWARTTALKHNCHVVVGYPEKVDCAKQWPSSPEYYNSAIVVNPDGETVANYRKCHLYSTDETWALESPHGFFREFIPGLGQTSMGLCMDIKFTSPWDAFEFGYHILHSESNLVIVSMAWITNKDRTRYSSMPYDPDLETLAYWATRLEPVIRAEDSHEIIVVFCNRCGSEGESVYAGTSAVLGIKGGEVSVYGLLGRGEKELLVVDTDQPAFAKMVLCSSPQEDYVASPEYVSNPVETRSSPRSRRPTEPDAAAIAGTFNRSPLTTSLPKLPERQSPSVSSSSGKGKGKFKGKMREEEHFVAPLTPYPTRGSRRLGSDSSSPGSSPSKSRPSLPKLHIPQDSQVWQKDETGRHQQQGDKPSSVTTSSSTKTRSERSGQSSEAHFSNWLQNQAKAAAAHPKQNKLNPDSGIEVSPGSFLSNSVRSSARPAVRDNVQNRSNSPPKSGASSRNRRATSRGGSDRVAALSRRTRSAGRNDQDNRLTKFKDSPKVEKPDQVILDQFLQALAEARLSSVAIEPMPLFSTITERTLDLPESIPIAASPSVLQTAFPPIALRTDLDTLLEDPAERKEAAPRHSPIFIKPLQPHRSLSYHEQQGRPMRRGIPSVSSA